jgi:archaemetzincin
MAAAPRASSEEPSTFEDDISEALSDFGVLVCRVPHDPDDAPIDAKRLIRQAAAERNSNQRLLLVADREIQVPPLHSVFGYADWRKAAAVVSTARLRDPDDPARMYQRLRNVAAHEIGHLDGLNHCRRPRCVMSQASTPEELDGRPLTRCGRCPRSFARLRSVLGAVAALLVLAISLFVLDRTTSLFAGAGPDFPFL